jgi:hypothetical protein
MRSFQRRETLDPVPGSIVATLRRIDVAAGAEARYLDQLPQLLDALRDCRRACSSRPGRRSFVRSRVSAAPLYGIDAWLSWPGSIFAI